MNSIRRLLAGCMAAICCAAAMSGCSLAGAPQGQTSPKQVVSSISSKGEKPAAAQPQSSAVQTAAPAEQTEMPTGNLISPTTGRLGTTDTYRPIIVQIENEINARPQAGLQWADVVYETLMEGNITRFTAVFNDILYAEGAPETLEVGPVRSSRYYHQWIQGGWDALYIHLGGAETPGRESYIWGASSEHIKQRINGAGKHPSHPELIYRRRGTGKALEHTAYTELRADAAVMNYDPVQYQFLKFEPAQSYDTDPEISSVSLSFWDSQNFVEYRYDAQLDKLIRYMGGQPFMAEETGKPIEVQNLVIQYTSVSDFPDEGSRKRIEMFGSGDAEFFIHGRYLKGTWSREQGGNTPTIFKLENGEEVTFAPGNTWIEVHPDNKPVTTVFADGSESVQNG